MKYDQNPELTCCIVIPLQFGVQLIAMCTFMEAFMGIFALLSGDVRFQDTGYDTRFYYLTPVVGALGAIFGIIGLFGVNDANKRLLRLFSRYLFVKLVVDIIASVADYRTIRACANGSYSTVYTQTYMVNDNPQLYALAALGLCRTAKWAYLFGSLCTIGLKFYFWHVVSMFLGLKDCKPCDPISFAQGGWSVEKHWKMYEVKDPRSDIVMIHQGQTEKEKRAIAEEEAEEARKAMIHGNNFLVGYGYGATEATPAGEHWAATKEAMEEAQKEKNAETPVRLGQLAGNHNVEFESLI